MKKLISVFLAIVLLLCSVAVVASAAGPLVGPGTMYVYTENGKGLNVRSTPDTGDNIIGSVKYGGAVQVSEFQGSWAVIEWGDTYAYVQKRFLQWYVPGPKPTPRPTENPDSGKNAELRSEVAIEPLHMEAQATRASGWVNMRVAPSKNTRRVQTCPDGSELIASGETTNWYHVTDPATGNSGYIRKDFLKVIPAPAPVVDEETQIGTLNVNGKFLLQGKIPDGYKLQVISARSSKVIATLVSDDVSKPQMMLTIAFNDTYSDVERMNDLTAEEIETLKASYTDMNEVTFSEAQTAAGTKLLIAKETGSDEDFVSILSLYKGYSVEFVLSPNPDAASPTLTDAQIQTAVDFLSNLDFIPAAT